jgi:hypothetical protein
MVHGILASFYSRYGEDQYGDFEITLVLISFDLNKMLMFKRRNYTKLETA